MNLNTKNKLIGLKDIHNIRKDFPVINQNINDHPLVYLDSAASSQMPHQVINEISRYQSNDHANVHRGIHSLSHRATDVYETARSNVCSFINAKSKTEVIFTRGTTESINLVAQSYCKPKLDNTKKILITHLEHHSNIVPWQLICEETGAELIVAPIDNDGQIITNKLLELLDSSVVIVAISHVSNALGSITEVKKIISAAHEHNIPVLVDGAQAISHMSVDVQDLDADFYTFSGHKMLGPTGIGILYGREEILEVMPPYQGGGDMILEVKFSGTVFNELPYKFEAGTPNISGAAGLGAAIDYLKTLDMQTVEEHESNLLAKMIEKLKMIEGVQLIGTAKEKIAVQSFVIQDIHSHDIGTILDHQGIAIRTGHHCAMPAMEFFGLSGTARASLSVYNNEEDIDRFISGLAKVMEIFS
jgi:cysteine desulfurase/selenocysteine lyase|tara:strand:+ start:2775 stop:4025 length:1251 start_codon:yes stop_codon:yes gene_type:complete